MKANERYERILSLVKTVQRDPKKYRKALRAMTVSLHLAQKILSALETEADPGMSEALAWEGELIALDDPRERMKTEEPHFSVVSTLVLHTIELFVEILIWGRHREPGPSQDCGNCALSISSSTGDTICGQLGCAVEISGSCKMWMEKDSGT